MTDNRVSQDAVIIERTFDAPVDLVWQMWTDPEHFKAWYGPDGATIPVAEMDVRVGGTRLVCLEMRTPNGPRQMWFTGEYRDVVENKRLVYTEVHRRQGRQRGIALQRGNARGGIHDDRSSDRTRGRRRPYQDGADPCWSSRRLSRRSRLGDGARQARCPPQRRQQQLGPLNRQLHRYRRQSDFYCLSRPIRDGNRLALIQGSGFEHSPIPSAPRSDPAIYAATLSTMTLEHVLVEPVPDDRLELTLRLQGSTSDVTRPSPQLLHLARRLRHR